MEFKHYSIGQMAKRSGVSIRALHHYESMGLMKPQRLDNGYRVYGPDDVERLEHILLYRACGVELADIKRLLDAPDFDAHTALEHHLETLRARKLNLESLIATVEKTLQTLEGGIPMTDKEHFENMKQAALRLSRLPASGARQGPVCREKQTDRTENRRSEHIFLWKE